MAQAFDVQNNNAEVASMDQNGNLTVDGTITLGAQTYTPLPPTGMVTLSSNGTALTMTDVNGNVNTVSSGGSGGGSQFGNITVTGNEVITGNIASQPAVAGNTVFSTNVGAGDTFDRFRIIGSGNIAIGSGTIQRDVTIGRTTGGTAKTGFVTSNLQVGSSVDLADDGVGELKLANATTVPTVAPTGGALVYASGGGVFHKGPSGTVTAMVQGNRVGAPMSSATLAETANRSTVTTSVAPASGTLFIWSVFLMAGQTVSNIGFCTGTTAANNPTHSWTVLLDNTYKLQAHSADKTNTAIPASTWQNYAMVTPYVATYTGIYYMGIMVTTSTAQPTLLCNATAPAAQFITGTNVPTPLVGGTSSTGQTVPGTDNSTVYAAPTAATQTIYMYAT